MRRCSHGRSPRRCLATGLSCGPTAADRHQSHRHSSPALPRGREPGRAVSEQSSPSSVGMGAEGWLTGAGVPQYLLLLPRMCEKMAAPGGSCTGVNKLIKPNRRDPGSVSSGGGTCLAPGAAGGGKRLLWASPRRTEGFVPGILPSACFPTGETPPRCSLPASRRPGAVPLHLIRWAAACGGEPGDETRLARLAAWGGSSAPTPRGQGELGFFPQSGVWQCSP